MEGLASQLELLVLFVHLDVAAAGYTAGTHTTSNNGSVRSHTATNRQDTLRCLHAGDVFRRGFQTNQDYLSPFAFQASASSAVKTILPQAAPGEAPRPLPIGVAAFRALASNCGCSRVSRFLGRSSELLLLRSCGLRLPGRKRSAVQPERFSYRYGTAACTASCFQQ